MMNLLSIIDSHRERDFSKSWKLGVLPARESDVVSYVDGHLLLSDVVVDGEQVSFSTLFGTDGSQY